MDWLALIEEIFRACVVPLLAVLTTYLVKYIQAQAAKLSAQTDNEITAKYIQMLADTITSCVISTNQTYVDSLKDKDAFDLDAQKEAFKITYESVLLQLTDEATKYLEAVYGDLNAYIMNRIEMEVNLYKQEA